MCRSCKLNKGKVRSRSERSTNKTYFFFPPNNSATELASGDDVEFGAW
jgi:hypothetical protein